MEDSLDIIHPITAEQQLQVTEETNNYIEQAADLFNIKMKHVEILHDLKGRAAGMYRVYRNKREIRYNPYIFSKYYEDNFASTIPHEVAHYVSDIIYGLHKIKPHGKEWKAIMHTFNADASVTSNYDLSGIPLRKQTLFTYHCGCQDHRISSIRHNKIKSNRGKYFCRKCKRTLQWKKQENKAA